MLLVCLCVVRVFCTTLFPHNFGVCHFFLSNVCKMTTTYAMYEYHFYFLILLLKKSSTYTMQFSSASQHFFFRFFSCGEEKNGPAKKRAHTNDNTIWQFNCEWKSIHLYLYSTKTTDFRSKKKRHQQRISQKCGKSLTNING